MNQFFEFSINLPEHKTTRIYLGQTKYLMVVTDDGLKLQFPIANFRPFVSDRGIHGRFRAETDEDHRLLSLTKL